jgi:tRNA threonylcarbamoyladenosine biosynthesis protein TsaB
LKILALDTATETGGAALLEDEVLRAEARVRVVKTHAAGIWKTIFFLLEQSGWDLSDIDLWAASIGPGSFTGLRIGLATIKGLALATAKPVVGISTLEALASSFPCCPYLIRPLIDARKKEVFCAGFRSDPRGRIQMVEGPRNIRPQILVREIKEPVLFVGNGALLYRDFILENLGEMALFPEPHLHYISPLGLGTLALSRYRQNQVSSPQEISPLYIRLSDAEYMGTAVSHQRSADSRRPMV